MATAVSGGGVLPESNRIVKRGSPEFLADPAAVQTSSLWIGSAMPDLFACHAPAAACCA